MPLYQYVCEKCEHDFEELVFGPKRWNVRAVMARSWNSNCRCSGCRR